MKYLLALVFAFVSPILLYFLYEYLINFVKYPIVFNVIYITTSFFVWLIGTVMVFTWAEVNNF